MIAGGHAETLQHIVAEPARGLVGGIGHQNLVPRLQHCQKGSGHRRQAGREKAHRRGSFQFGQGVDQGALGSQAAAAIGNLGAIIEGGRVRHQHG
jgi:hypothetical protein